MRHDEVMRVYSNVNLRRNLPELSPIPSARQRSVTAKVKPLRRLPLPPPQIESYGEISQHVEPIIDREFEDETPAEEHFEWSTEPIYPTEEAYYEKCQHYYNITHMPLISVSDNIFDDNIELTSATLVFAIDEDQKDDIVISKIQKGCVKVVFDFIKNLASQPITIQVKALYYSLTDKIKEELANLKVFFMFMGDLKSLDSKQKFRYDMTLYPQFNHLYVPNKTFWTGTSPDGLDRGNQPYYCPTGWKRYSFYVTENFYEKFKGWCICYHGTKFSHGLSILLSGLAPARIAAHGQGIYATPSITYACHPRYSEVKKIESSHERVFFKNGNYIQFVLQCRVHPNNMINIDRETLKASATKIDSNINNDAIEWIIDAQEKSLMDFNDPNSTIICTGIMVRVTDNHPGLLPESQWCSIFIIGISLDIFGLKWSIILSEIGYILYIVANIYPLPVFMYISAALVGFVAAPLWASQAVYLGRIAHYYAQHKHQTPEVYVSLFFAIFFAIFGTNIFWCNLISYFVLNQSNHHRKLIVEYISIQNQP
ncbi:unnamed protein product [Rotaria sp. Silwood1]|nr:unnamed protein product [Rotaria sp. Silwood1]CAF1649686.1 unnamed protein product [Rotaria sp. Silwood1]CAF3788130.1 unnamed protein product [Rotaria sp. Silwood1]CAF4787397.1 unnamed protein product [Rotaria sp. Silwood1]